MKLNVISIIVLLCITSNVFSQNAISDEDAIKKVIQTAYVEGLQNEGDIDKIDSGIHPDFVLIGIEKENNLWKLPIEEWKKKTIKKKKEGLFPRTGEKKVKIEFKSIDITGTAAVAKIDFYIGDIKKYVDYIALYKFEDGWKMVHKIFYKFP